MLKGQTLMPAPLGNGKLGLMALDSQEVSADSRGHVEEVHSRQFRSDCTRSGRLVNVSPAPRSKVQALSCANVVEVESSDDVQLLRAWDLVDSDKRPSLPKVIPVDSDHE